MSKNNCPFISTAVMLQGGGNIKIAEANFHKGNDKEVKGARMKARPWECVFA